VATELAALLWTFLLQASDLRRDEVRRIVEESIPPEEKEQFMSTAEMLKEEGRQEGRAEGRQALCDSVLDLLETRFHQFPPGLRDSVLQVQDLAQLRALVRRAGVCASFRGIRGRALISPRRGHPPHLFSARRSVSRHSYALRKLGCGNALMALTFVPVARRATFAPHFHPFALPEIR